MLSGSLAHISTRLVSKKETLAIAESVTSGLVMAAISLAEDATAFFQGGITAYNLGQKTKHLNVEPIYAERENSVSKKVAETMSVEVAEKFCSDWGIGITGYAVPVPELNIRTCFAFYAFSYRGKVVLSRRTDSKQEGQENVQKAFVETVLKEYAQVLKKRAS
jgi:nicotinamide-nucleotide amidase